MYAHDFVRLGTLLCCIAHTPTPIIQILITDIPETVKEVKPSNSLIIIHREYFVHLEQLLFK